MKKLYRFIKYAIDYGIMMTIILTIAGILLIYGAIECGKKRSKERAYKIYKQMEMERNYNEKRTGR